MILTKAWGLLVKHYCQRPLQSPRTDFHYLGNATVTDEQRQRIISRLNGRNRLDAFEAAKAHRRKNGCAFCVRS